MFRGPLIPLIWTAVRKTVLEILAIALVPCCAFAVDGQVLINQSTVMAAGGFPYTISQPGSYKLSGNLNPTNLTAIQITANNVALDLNGFTISCNSCITPPCNGATCTGTLADGILVSGSVVTIMNGTITGFIAGNGINFTSGRRLVVDHVKATENNIGIRSSGGGGVLSVSVCDLSDNATNVGLYDAGRGDSGSGISMSVGLVTGSVISENGSYGVLVGEVNAQSGASITNNFIFANGQGIRGNSGLGSQTAFGLNTITNNTFGDVSGATSMGNNVCSSGPC